MLAAQKKAHLSVATKLRIQGDPNAKEFYQRCGAIQVGELTSLSFPGRMLPLFEITLN